MGFYGLLQSFCLMQTFLCSLVCEDEKQVVAMKSQLQQHTRPMYNNPPVHDAYRLNCSLKNLK